jgi:hypothetical protein
MYSNRRSFLRVGSLLVCGSFLRPRGLFALGAEKSPAVLSFNAEELRLLDFVASYSSVVRIVGASVLGRMRPGSSCGLRLLVQVSDFRALAAALPNAPFKNIFSKENSISFSLLGSANVIENLAPEDFAARIAALTTKENLLFAHDAIVYDPIGKALDDPFGALVAGELKLMHPPTKTPAALEVAMRGTGDARAAELPEGESFAHWKAQLVKLTAHPKAAYPIANAFVRSLPAFAALAGSDEVKSALATPLISSSVKAALGISANSVIAEFDRLRAIFGQSYRDNAIWLVALLQKQFETNAREWITIGVPHEVHWREAFATAREIELALKSPEFKTQT